MTSIDVLPARALTPETWTAWGAAQASTAELDSPFFRPELTQITASVRDDVEVAVIRDGGRAAGFFPFQRGPGNIAQPVVGRLSEFHGVIAPPDLDWTPEQLLRAADLRSWHFDHLPLSQRRFHPYVWGEAQSPCMDLSHGYEAYREALRRQGSSLAQAERKGRKLAREVGPLRFEFHTDDRAVLEQLIDWKTQQHERTGMLQVMKVEWVVQLLDRVRQIQTPEFSGPLSALYAGETLMAVHLGVCSQQALHIWFPAYNRDYEQYSPGLVLLLELARTAAARGIARIDFGRASERYKENFSNASVPIAEGSIDRRWVHGRVHRNWFRMKRWMRNSPWRTQLEAPLNATRRLRQWLAFR